MDRTFKVETGSDLLHVELHMRKLFNTEDGQPCQQLLTNSYQLWTMQVKFYLRSQSMVSAKISKFDIDTYLPNYHLVFDGKSVTIQFIRPNVNQNKVQNKKCASTNEDMLNTKSKKRKCSI